VPVAVKACVVPTAIEADVGVMAIDVNVAAVTVSVAELLVTPDNEAEIVDVPAATPVAIPALPPPVMIVAADVFEEIHVTVEVMFWVLVSL
jgi:hypothetical protein